MFFAILLVTLCVTDAAQLPSTSTRKQYDGYKVLSVTPINERQQDLLHHLMRTDTDIDFWQEPSYVGSEVHMMVRPEHLSRIETLLSDEGLDYEAHIDNVQDQLTPMWNDIDSRSSIDGQKAFDIDNFNTLDDIYAWMDTLAENCRSGLVCEVYSVGNSYEGRPIKVFKISKPEAGRKAYWIDATIHAREWIATATTIKILNHLATGGDANAVALVDKYDWYVMPVMNVDGYSYTWTSDRLWRKNRRPNSGSTCVGTDLNRNFAYSWGTDGVSFNPCSDTFCGASAGSEPETVVQSAELIRLAPTLIGIVTVHSYGQYFMFSWGTTVNRICERTPDHAELMVVADATANAIQETYGARWARGNSCEVIYATSGSTQDFAKGAAGIKYSFTPELRGNSFIIAASNIPLSFNEVWNGVVAMSNSINA